MRDYIELRAIEVGKYIIDSKATVRKTATKFGVSKSTVHKDLTERLPQIDHHLAGEVRDILDINKSGEAYPGWYGYKTEVFASSSGKLTKNGLSELL